MPLTAPPIDDRSYEELRTEALRRIPVHNPSWTNFNASDPGVTLVEVFAFMTENLLYRVNLMPERNRLKFLSLLGVPLQPASSARGIVAFTNDRGPLETLTLSSGVEVRAGQVGFRTDVGLDILPVEARVYYKRPIELAADVAAEYQRLYASYAAAGRTSADITPYQTQMFDASETGLDIVRDTVDGSLWVALLIRASDKEAGAARVRSKIGGKVMTLGIVPVTDVPSARLAAGVVDQKSDLRLRYSMPSLPADRLLPADPAKRIPAYRRLDPTSAGDVGTTAQTVQLTLPSAGQLGVWENLDPLESGVGDFPPSIDDTAVSDRLVTWLRVQASTRQPTRLLWVGINATTITQRVPVVDEVLPDGTGDPNQVLKLARRPVLPRSVRLTVTTGADTNSWHEVPDLLAAGAEVELPDQSAPPGRPSRDPAEADVFVVDAEAGELHFGDGDRGARPPNAAQLRASYDVSDGTAGNVAAGAISSGPTLPPGVKVANPLRTWGGADAETTPAGEKRIGSFLKHGERLVAEEDFRAIASATPGLSVGRVDVLPAFDPALSANEPGDAPGAVTLLVLPSYDPANPGAPEPDPYFLNTMCSYLDPRRLVTAEIFLRGPVYKPVYVSVGIETVGETSIAEVREAVKTALTSFLSPLPSAPPAMPPFAHSEAGWPLRYGVRRLELETHAARVNGVRLIRDVLLAGTDGVAVERVEIAGLELPRLAGIAVVIGDPEPIADVMGEAAPPPADRLAVPIAEETC